MNGRLAAAFALLPEYLGWHVLLSVSALSPKGVRRAAFFIYLGAIAVMMALPVMGRS